MENLPQISSIPQKTQFRSQNNRYQKIQNNFQLKKSTISSQNRNLSPFTWNNLKLPAVLIKSKLQNESFHKKSDTLKKLSNTIDFTGISAKFQPLNDNKIKIKNLFNPDIQNHRPKGLSNHFQLHEQVIKQNQRTRFTSQYQKNKQKMTAQIKRLNEARNSLNTNQAYRLKGSISKSKSNESSLNQSLMNSQRNSSISKNSESVFYYQMQPFMKNYFVKLSRSSQGPKYFVTSNPKYQPLHRNQLDNKNFVCQSFDKQQRKTLIWTKNPNQNIFKQKSAQQYYNHIEGSHVITSKQKLHEVMNRGKGESGLYYPLSFSLPNEYSQFVEQYDWILVKMTLKLLIKEIDKFYVQFKVINQKEDGNQKQNCSVCLSDIIDQLLRDMSNELQINLLKLCLFLENKIKNLNLESYFQTLPSYRQIQIKLSQNMYIDVIEWCLLTKDSLLNQNHENISFQNIDYQLLQLLKSYDYIFTQNLPIYLYKNLNIQQNMWIVKPFASSKAAGISIISSNPQFYTTHDYQYKQFRHKPKYQNKIIMKYLTNPFLIKHSGIDYFAKKIIKQITSKFNHQQYDEFHFKHKIKEVNEKVDKFIKLQQKFCNRKFDIRQWVLIVCEEQSAQVGQKIDKNSLFSQKKFKSLQKPKKKIKIYKYHTGYCRFALKPYSLESKDLQIHLNNYQLHKKQNSSIKSPKYFNKQEKDSFISSKKNGFTSNESVLMLNQLFQYLGFLEELKPKNKQFDMKEKSQIFSNIIQDKYEKQLDKILEKVFKSSYRHLIHNVGTYELFGFDLFVDQEMNLYLLEVNLNPGCASERSQKLQKQAEQMLQSMLKIVIKSDQKIDFDMKQVTNDPFQGNLKIQHQNKWIEVCSKDILY